MRKHTLTAGLAVAAALFGTFAGAAPAAASTPGPGGGITPMAATGHYNGVTADRDELGTVVATLPGEFHVGDCQQDPGATVTLLRTSPTGGVKVVWDATVLSAHPQAAWYDQWHQGFTLKTARGTTIAEVGGLDGPQMRKKWERKHAHASKDIWIDPDFYRLIATVDWHGEC